MVCGSPTVDVDLLKVRACVAALCNYGSGALCVCCIVLICAQRCTNYESLSESDELVARFWRVLRNMPEAEKSLFLKFVWGRSRLPLSESQFTQRMKLTRLNHSYVLCLLFFECVIRFIAVCAVRQAP